MSEVDFSVLGIKAVPGDDNINNKSEKNNAIHVPQFFCY